MGNRHPLYTPHGIFPAQGEDQWIAIAAETDAQWRALCIEFDLDASRWPTAAARKADEAAIEAQIAERTARYDKMALSAALAARGVTSAPVLDAREVAEDETLRRRGHVVRVEHPEAGPMWQSALPAKLSRTPIGPIRPAPLQGEHSFEVFRSLIGMRVAEYDALVAAEVSGSGPTARHETSQS
jgi:benzylsuccinate CoA-transferase BbsF subunit